MGNMLMALIEEKRCKLHLTVEEFCRRIDVDVSTYYKWKADPDRMKLSTARKIAEVLSFTVAEKKQVF